MIGLKADWPSLSQLSAIDQKISIKFLEPKHLTSSLLSQSLAPASKTPEICSANSIESLMRLLLQRKGVQIPTHTHTWGSEETVELGFRLNP